MHKVADAPVSARFADASRFRVTSAWLARRWYYTPRSHRAYSVRQVSPGDRRLLAEFAVSLGEAGVELATLLLDRVIVTGESNAVGFVALEGTAAGDRVIGAAAYADVSDGATFAIAVAQAYREEQVGRTLLATLVRHAKRVGVRQLSAQMSWSNRPMQMLAMSTGFSIEPVQGDRGRRLLVLRLK